MPEGHTLHRLAFALNNAFTGQTVAATSPQGRLAESAAEINRPVMLGASAPGKDLFCAFEPGRWLPVQLGPAGTLLLWTPDPPRGQLRLRLASPQTVDD